MPYTCMNIGVKLNVRADRRAQRRSAEKTASGNRWEFKRGMYGNVVEVVDHQDFRWYRQDREVEAQGDLFDGFLPYQCDYCRQVVNQISHVEYKSVYWYYVRPHLPTAEWKRTEIHLKFACCTACMVGPLPIPSGVIGYHMTELYQGGRLLLQSERRK